MAPFYCPYPNFLLAQQWRTINGAQSQHTKIDASAAGNLPNPPKASVKRAWPKT
jgi:hypothetical protein